MLESAFSAEIRGSEPLSWVAEPGSPLFSLQQAKLGRGQGQGLGLGPTLDQPGLTRPSGRLRAKYDGIK